MAEIILNTSALKVSQQNVRRSGQGDVSALSASIASIGLIHPLKVLPVAERKGRVTHEIVAGGRRFGAIKAGIKAGILPKDFEIRCDEVTLAEALEISIAENIVRQDMHPADQYDAFRDLADKGKSVSDIAAKFSMTEAAVTRRLRLGRVHPEIFAAYRDEKISQQQISAYAYTEDQEKQLAIFNEFGAAYSADQIRRALLPDQVSLTDKRVQFVTSEVYRAAGGDIIRDLFSELGNAPTGYIADVMLLDRLTCEQMAQALKEIEAEGWKWVEETDLYHWDLSRSFAGRSLAEDDRCRAGVTVRLTHNGTLEINRGWIRKEDMLKDKAAVRAGEGPTPKAPALSNAVNVDLSHLRNSMIGFELARNTGVALAALVHRMVLDLFYERAWDYSPLEIKTSDKRTVGSFDKEDAASPSVALDALFQAWNERLPDSRGEVLSWCLSQSQEELLALLALCTACGLDATIFDSSCSSSKHHAADALAAALDVQPYGFCDLANTAFFERTNKAYMLRVVAEQIGPTRAENLAGLKKAALVEIVTKELNGKWLPDPLLRTALHVYPEEDSLSPDIGMEGDDFDNEGGPAEE